MNNLSDGETIFINIFFNKYPDILVAKSNNEGNIDKFSK